MSRAVHRPTPAAAAAAAAMCGAAAVLGLLAPGAAAAAPPVRTAASADVDIRIVGGSSTAVLVCGNVASAIEHARQHRLVLQRNNCRPQAEGGDVSLTDVEIVVDRRARAASPDAAALARLAVDATSGPGGGGGTATSRADCTNLAGGGRAVQRNVCWAIGRGGRVWVSGVEFVVHHADGRTTTGRSRAAVLPARDGVGIARCANVVPRLEDQRDDCEAVGVGADLDLRAVDVIERGSDGSTTTRHDVDVFVKGGDANASVRCFNVADGGGHIVQINICSATGTGGDVRLRNVRIRTYEG